MNDFLPSLPSQQLKLCAMMSISNWFPSQSMEKVTSRSVMSHQMLMFSWHSSWLIFESLESSASLMKHPWLGCSVKGEQRLFVLSLVNPLPLFVLCVIPQTNQERRSLWWLPVKFISLDTRMLCVARASIDTSSVSMSSQSILRWTLPSWKRSVFQSINLSSKVSMLVLKYQFSSKVSVLVPKYQFKFSPSNLNFSTGISDRNNIWKFLSPFADSVRTMEVVNKSNTSWTSWPSGSSQTSTAYFGWRWIWTVADDGYGVSYIVAGEDTIFFHISSKKSSNITDSRSMHKVLELLFVTWRPFLNEGHFRMKAILNDRQFPSFGSSRFVQEWPLETVTSGNSDQHTLRPIVPWASNPSKNYHWEKLF